MSSGKSFFPAGLKPEKQSAQHYTVYSDTNGGKGWWGLSRGLDSKQDNKDKLATFISDPIDVIIVLTDDIADAVLFDTPGYIPQFMPYGVITARIRLVDTLRVRRMCFKEEEKTPVAAVKGTVLSMRCATHNKLRFFIVTQTKIRVPVVEFLDNSFLTAFGHIPECCTDNALECEHQYDSRMIVGYCINCHSGLNLAPSRVLEYPEDNENRVYTKEVVELWSEFDTIAASCPPSPDLSITEERVPESVEAMWDEFYKIQEPEQVHTLECTTHGSVDEVD